VKEKVYNIWAIEYNRWIRDYVGDVLQQPDNPIPMSFDDANAHCNLLNCSYMPNPWCEVRELKGNYKRRKIKKVMPDFPLDPTLPILQAGYLQDRERKHFKK
jgi:hypothetical protein